MSVRELEARLRGEPDNLGLRVALASALRDAGRVRDAIELFRSAAIAYRDQGRDQQAIAACRSILEVAPEDPRAKQLLAELAPGMQTRPSTPGATPLPPPMPHHVADPTRHGMEGRVRDVRDVVEVASRDSRESTRELGVDIDIADDVPDIADVDQVVDELASAIEQAADEPASEPIDEHVEPTTEHSFAATEQLERVEIDEVDAISTRRIETVSVDSLPEAYTDVVPREEVEEETTNPRDLLRGIAEAERAPAVPLERVRLIETVPAVRRAPVIKRFSRRTVSTGVTLIRQGESGHPLIVVARGRLEVRHERTDGRVVALAEIRDGEFVGEGALLARISSPVSVVATAHSELYALAPKDVYELAGTFPAMWAELKDVGERRTRDWSKKLGVRLG